MKFPLLGFSTQATGFFAQSWSWPELPHPTEKQEALRTPYYSEKNVRRWERAGALAKKLGCSINNIALAYVTSQSFASAALVGCHRLDQLRESLTAADLQLSPEDVAFLEEGHPI